MLTQAPPAPMPRALSIRRAATAPRQRASSPRLPDRVVTILYRMHAEEPPAGSWTTEAKERRAALDAYLARLYVEGQWPSGALQAALGRSRSVVARRVRRGLAAPVVTAVEVLPCPTRPPLRN